MTEDLSALRKAGEEHNRAEEEFSEAQRALSDAREDRDSARAERERQVVAAREGEASWQEIGDALGVSKQRAIAIAHQAEGRR